MGGAPEVKSEPAPDESRHAPAPADGPTPPLAAQDAPKQHRDGAAALVGKFQRLQQEVCQKVLNVSMALIQTGQPLPNLRSHLPELPAQDDLQEAPSHEEVVDYARYLGMDVVADADLLHIAEWALTAPVPEGWTVHLDQEGHEFFCNAAAGKSQYEHPMDEHYKEMYLQAKQGKETAPAGGGAPVAGPSGMPALPPSS